MLKLCLKVTFDAWYLFGVINRICFEVAEKN